MISCLKRRTAKSFSPFDTASKEGELNDYSACVTLLYHAGKYYLIYVFRGRFDYPSLRSWA